MVNYLLTATVIFPVTNETKSPKVIPATYFNTMCKHLNLSKRNSHKLRYHLNQFSICSNDITNDYIDTRSDYLKPTLVWEKILCFVRIFHFWCLCLMKFVTHLVFLIELIIFFSHYPKFLKDWVLFIDASAK